MYNVDLYVDGACSGNPGPGGWAAILVCKGQERVYSGGCADTTNNRMELEAVRQGLLHLTVPCHVTIHTDSRNVIGWLSGEFKKKNGHIADLVECIRAIALEHRHVLEFVKVTGHSGHAYNERCDKLARRDWQ